MGSRIFWIKRRTSHTEIARINRFIQVSLTKSRNVRRVQFKERFTINKIQTKASNIVKPSFRELYDSKLSGLHAFDNMAIIHSV